MHLLPYPVAQTDNTSDFLVELQSRYPDAKLTICWDNARWHKGTEMERFLGSPSLAVNRPLCGKDTLAKEVKLGATIGHPLDELQAIDLPFNLAV